MAPTVQNHTVNYAGQEATVISENNWSNYITIEINGETKLVSKKDPLFNFAESNNSSSYYTNIINSCDKRIERNKEIIKENNTLWTTAKETIKSCRNKMNSILSSNHARTFKDIKDEGVKEEYLALMSDKSSAKRTQLKASAAVIDAAISTGSACSTKRNFLSQQALYERLA